MDDDTEADKGSTLYVAWALIIVPILLCILMNGLTLIQKKDE